jgi:flagellar hook-basal body complex protein FliE
VIVPAIGGIAGGLGTVAGNLVAGSPQAGAAAALPAPGVGTLGAVGSPSAATAGLEGATGLEGAGGVEGLGGAGGSPGVGGVEGAGGTPSFGSALSDAISSLEEGQQSAAAASQALATGKASDPAAAVSTVEDASLEMQLAAQLRSKASEAAQTIFQTQV